MDEPKLPVGFGMALAMDTTAMRAFSAKSEKERDAILEKARTVTSKREMQRLVRSLSDGGFPNQAE